MSVSSSTKEEISLKKFKEKVINDFRTVSLSREVSVQGRREVLLGKGKFGIFGDGKELPQVVMSHFLKMEIIDQVLQGSNLVNVSKFTFCKRNFCCCIRTS